MTKETNPHSGETVAKRMIWLAWQACGGPLGWGALQDNPSATEDAVWANVHTGPLGGDYPARDIPNLYVAGAGPGKVYGDYVFGRMMKIGLSFTTGSVEWDSGRIPREDYQSWCSKYPTYQDLYDAAVKSLNS